ncbi:LysR family transcriptional regulator [Pseudoalteromonas luteoviolacea]|uniref:LysR family transcriptional regulator n=1 Tax=Pseudoalteromonas luteoviolacea TaxID=43657 RepID=A0A1C0TWK2_9GAMM|nr:LysR family transcriptional regulator [Pseudoalteromonas luteoviolacea]OCQ23693.1 LysR family transcriptional regulator [Pseudoalteromonas luteoviolacea]
MLEEIEIKWLVSFKAIYENCSIKLAAEKLHLPTSNVSRHLALLEAQLNVRLLERTTRKMHPTIAGKMLFDSLTPNLLAIEEALVSAKQGGEVVAGHLKVMTPDLPFMADIVAEFAVNHPQLRFSCDTQLNPKEGLLDGFDVVLTFNRGQLDDSGWVAKEMCRWASCVVAAPSLLDKHTNIDTLEALSKQPCITTHSVMQGMPWRFKENITLNVQSRFKVNSGHMAKSAALKGIGFALLPLHACAAEIASGELVKINLNNEPEDLVLNAFYSGKKHVPVKVKRFIEHVQLAIKQLE